MPVFTSHYLYLNHRELCAIFFALLILRKLIKLNIPELVSTILTTIFVKNTGSDFVSATHIFIISVHYFYFSGVKTFPRLKQFCRRYKSREVSVSSRKKLEKTSMLAKYCFLYEKWCCKKSMRNVAK